MNREHEDLVELGTASLETRGGPYGADDHWGSLMVPDTGLAQD